MREASERALQWGRERERLEGAAARLGKELEETKRALAEAEVRAAASRTPSLPPAGWSPARLLISETAAARDLPDR